MKEENPLKKSNYYIRHYGILFREEEEDEQTVEQDDIQVDVQGMLINIHLVKYLFITV